VHWVKHQAMAEPTLTAAHARAGGFMGT
jgi:hypothetical protein